MAAALGGLFRESEQAKEEKKEHLTTLQYNPYRHGHTSFADSLNDSEQHARIVKHENQRLRQREVKTFAPEMEEIDMSVVKAAMGRVKEKARRQEEEGDDFAPARSAALRNALMYT